MATNYNTENHRPPHNITMNDRAHMEICGVKEVLSFDDIAVSLMTECGALDISGAEIKVSVIDVEKGRIVLDGRIDLLSYRDTEKPESGKGGFLSRLLR